MIKKLTLFITILISGFFIFSSVVLAEDPLAKACSTNPDAVACKSSTTEDPITGQNGILTKVVEILGWVVGVAAVIMIIVNGLRMVLSNGNSDTVASAKNGIIFALVGIAVAILAQAIVIFVLRKL